MGSYTSSTSFLHTCSDVTWQIFLISFSRKEVDFTGIRTNQTCKYREQGVRSIVRSIPHQGSPIKKLGLDI